MPVPEQAGADEVEVIAVSLEVADDEELPPMDERREASIWLALLAAEMARDGSMAISKKKWVDREPEFFWQ